MDQIKEKSIILYKYVLENKKKFKIIKLNTITHGYSLNCKQFITYQDIPDHSVILKDFITYFCSKCNVIIGKCNFDWSSRAF